MKIEMRRFAEIEKLEKELDRKLEKKFEREMVKKKWKMKKQKMGKALEMIEKKLKKTKT